MAIVGLALGSNLGLKLQNLQRARDFLKELTPLNSEFIQAPIYQSAPLLCPDGSPDFFNTAIELHYDGSPHQLLAKTQEIEKVLERQVKTELNEPRPIDIDILYFDDLIINSDDLTIPHPRIAERRFALQPLVEICPERTLANESLTISALLEQIPLGAQPLVELQSSW